MEAIIPPGLRNITPTTTTTTAAAAAAAARQHQQTRMAPRHHQQQVTTTTPTPTIGTLSQQQQATTTTETTTISILLQQQHQQTIQGHNRHTTKHWPLSRTPAQSQHWNNSTRITNHCYHHHINNNTNNNDTRKLVWNVIRLLAPFPHGDPGDLGPRGGMGRGDGWHFRLPVSSPPPSARAATTTDP